MEDDGKTERVYMFDGSNFMAWKFRTQVLLEEHDLFECVETEAAEIPELQELVSDTAAKAEEKQKLREKRRKQDRKCRSLLISRISDSQLEYVQEKKTPKEIWDALKRVFERRSIASRMHLKRQMLSLRFEGGSLRDHFLCFDRLVRAYRATGAEMEELDIVCHLLLTLGPSFSTVVTAIETMPEDKLSLEFVKCRLLDEEVKRKGIGAESCTPKSDSAAFSTRKQEKKKKKVLQCFGCKQEGHKLADCPKKKESETKNVKQKSRAHLAEEGGGVCFVGVAKGAVAPDESSRLQWFIDSGCSDHLVNDRALFDKLEPLESPVEIAVAKNGETILAKHSGTVRVLALVQGKYTECFVNNVLFVPELRCNLFSVLRVDQIGMKVTYQSGKVWIHRGSELVACGSRYGKLYRLDFFTEERGASESLMSCGRISKDLELWHRRFGHLNTKSIEKLIREEMVVGLKPTSGCADKQIVVCEPCVTGKQTRKPFVVRDTKRSSRVLELIHSDVCGPVTPVGLDEVRYFVTFIDDWSHFTMTFLIATKDEVFECFRQYEAYVTAKFDQRVCRLRCDNGGEYRSKEFDRFCKGKGIQVEWTVPHTPEQNGVSERMNRTLVEKARSMLEDSQIDKRFWGQAIQTAAYLVNRSPSSALDSNVTPFELWEGRKPDVSKLRVFGCPMFVHIPKEHRKKLDAKAWKGTFVGYTHNGYRVWDPRTKKIVHARDVDCIEGGMIESDGRKPSTSGFVKIPGIRYDPEDSDDEEETEDPVSDDSESDSDEESSDDSDDEFGSFEEEEDASEPAAEPVAGAQAQAPAGGNTEGRPQRHRTAPAWHDDFEVEYAGYALNAMNYVENLPTTVAEARKRDDWSKWEAAMRDEMDSLSKNKTWHLEKLPPGRSAVTNKWVFRIKRGLNGEPDRYKARLVARGFSQKFGFDYTETYSPVAKLDTLRTVLALANHKNMVVHQMDVATAFLNGKLDEEIYMVQPEGFERGDGLVCRLDKSLYGLKQASKAWNDRFHGFIVERLGFTRSANDQCLYLKQIGKETVILVIYVDDVVLAGSTLRAVEAVKRCLATEFQMTDGGEIRCFLGMCIDRDVEGKVLKISQRRFLEDLLRRFGMDECKPVSTPLEVRLKLEKGTEEKRTTQPYRELVGCLTYASLTTRPDLAAAVNYFSQYQSCPTDAHWVHLKRILRYIKGTLDLCLVYKADEAAAVLEVYSDADWANDTSDRRSISGCLFKVLGCTIGWITRKQKTVSLSSTEAELNALCNAACHQMWLIRLLKDLGLDSDEPTTFFEDNQSTIRIAESSKDFGRLKHVDVKLQFLKDLVREGRIRLEYLRSEDQTADIMTKGLPVGAFRRHRIGIGLIGSNG